MAWLVLSHLMASGLALLSGILVATRSRPAIRRRDAARWAYEAARAEAERARLREARVRAALEGALKREVAALEQAEDTKALAATLEAEMVAARWEKEELEQRSRATQSDLEAKAQNLASIHAALVDAVRRAALEDQTWSLQERRPLAEPEELIRFGGAAATARAQEGARS